MRGGAEGTKCYHLIWVTRGGRPTFKIAAAARFCERAAAQASVALGWTPELVAVLPDRLHLLVRAPGTLDRRAVARRLREQLDRLLAGAPGLLRRDQELWDGRGWCGVLATAASAGAVRQHLLRKLEAAGRSAPPASARPAAARPPSRPGGQ